MRRPRVVPLDADASKPRVEGNLIVAHNLAGAGRAAGFDWAHLEEVYSDAQEMLRLELKVLLKHSSAHVHYRRVDKLHYVYRITSDVDVPLFSATRSIVAPSRATDIADFVLSEEPVAIFQEPDPYDDGLGCVQVCLQISNTAGFRMEVMRAHASRRLPDGTTIGVKAACDVDDASNSWTTRGYKDRLRALTVWHAVPLPSGSTRLTHVMYERRFTGWMPDFVQTQLAGRITLKQYIRAKKLVLDEYAAGQPKGFTAPFASGSAAPPARWGSAADADEDSGEEEGGEEGEEAPPPGDAALLRAFPPAYGSQAVPGGTGASDYFLRFTGATRAIDEPVVSGPSASVISIGKSQAVQMVSPPDAKALERAAEDMRSILDLTIQLEGLSVGGAKEEPIEDVPQEPEPLLPPIEYEEEGYAKDVARLWPKAEPSPPAAPPLPRLAPVYWRVGYWHWYSYISVL